ncbi:inorganic phosphate transporter [Nonomuraea sp. NPDC050556]|uniref:inorganic phosphate transporter n=1 Tax=Nonomuraea sp. NPDC050556 TaxID=3364369 RepID=UPI0037B60E57
MAWAVTLAFVLVCGANDGAALVALALRFPGSRAWLILPAALVCGPPLIGYGVAEAFTRRLATLDGPAPFLAGAAAALVVVIALTRLGLPTSLTLALIGGISGAALGAGLPVSWPGVLGVLGAGVAAPVVGLVLGYLIGAGSRRMPGAPSLVYGLHVLAYGAQCAAYAINDGQKMFAVVGMALGPGTSALGPGWLVLVAAVFCVGALGSLWRVGDRLGRGLALLRPLHIASAETAAAAAVLGSSALGSPVSMTQSLSAGAVGAAASDGARRVRWPGVLNLALAWLLTLPTAAALGALAGLAVR